MTKTTVYYTKKRLRISQFDVKNDQIRLLKNDEIPISGGDFTPAVLKEHFTKPGLAKTKIISCLFRYQVGMRFFSFPSDDEQEIFQMVNYEATEILPLKPEETVIRHLLLSKNATGYSDTLVIVTHKEEVSKLIEKFQESDLEITTLNLSSLAIFNCVQKFVLEEQNETSLDNLLVVYIEDEVVELSIIKDKRLAFSRGFLIEDISTLPNILISEIRRSLELSFEKNKEVNLDKIILSGRQVDLEMIKEAIADKFTFPLYLENKIDLALGLALTSENSVNLLSDEFIAKRQKVKLKKKLMISIVFIFLNIFLCSAVFLVNLNKKKAYLARLKEKLSQLKPEAQSVQNKLLRIQLFKMQLNSQLLILEAITDLTRSTPLGCTLNMLSINEQGILVVRGQAENSQDVLDFVLELEKSSYFRNSHLNYSSRRKVKNEEIFDFEIQTELHKNETEAKK